jgi:hypothetical protein
MVYDVLGELFEGHALRDLLVDAIRYGDRPEKKAELFRNLEDARRNSREAQQGESTQPSPIPSSRRGLPTWASQWFPARLPTSASSSPMRPRSGPK